MMMRNEEGRENPTDEDEGLAAMDDDDEVCG
jgi:hypothetical protein